METHVPSPSGLLGSLRGFADSVVGSVHDRLELLSLELHEEKHRLVQILIWLSAIVVLALLVIIFASLAVLVVFWETARVAAALTILVSYVVGLAAAVIGFRKYLARQAKPFAGTLAELHHDRTCIRKET